MLNFYKDGYFSLNMEAINNKVIIEKMKVFGKEKVFYKQPAGKDR